MVKSTFGKGDWSDEVPAAGQRQQNNQEKVPYAKLKADKKGPAVEYTVRIVTDPYVYMNHKYNPTGEEKGFTYNIKASTPVESDPVTLATGKAANKRWVCGIINRSNQDKLEIFDFSSMIATKLKNLKDKKAWGDPRGYDVTITVNPKAGVAGYYEVSPNPHSPLSENDLKIISGMDSQLFDRLSAPATPEQVMKKVNEIRARINLPAMEWNAKPAATEVKEPRVMEEASAEDMKEEDFEFPAAATN
jgi:hypothetical protein